MDTQVDTLPENAGTDDWYQCVKFDVDDLPEIQVMPPDYWSNQQPSVYHFYNDEIRHYRGLYKEKNAV